MAKVMGEYYAQIETIYNLYHNNGKEMYSQVVNGAPTLAVFN